MGSSFFKLQSLNNLLQPDTTKRDTFAMWVCQKMNENPNGCLNSSRLMKRTLHCMANTHNTYLMQLSLLSSDQDMIFPIGRFVGDSFPLLLLVFLLQTLHSQILALSSMETSTLNSEIYLILCENNCKRGLILEDTNVEVCFSFCQSS